MSDGKHNHDHFTDRHAWLRAGVLGANDGIISTACLLAGFIGAGSSPDSLLFAGIAAIIAGALSMAAGEAVSVASQADAEASELAIEQAHLDKYPDFELDELTKIYVARGLNEALARQVATELMAHDALDAHRRDELGLTEQTAAQPLTAAFSSGVSFVAGAIIPFGFTWMALWLQAGRFGQTAWLLASTLSALVVLGYVSAVLSKAPRLKAVVRIFGFGLLALLLSLLLGEGAGQISF